MPVTHCRQPKGSKLCGPAAVATVAGVPLEAAVSAIVAAGVGRSYNAIENLRRGLARLGYRLAPFVSHPPASGRFPEQAVGLEPALARLRYVLRPNGYHWIAVNGAMVHDPIYARPVLWQAYVRLLQRRQARVSSYAFVREAGR